MKFHVRVIRGSSQNCFQTLKREEGRERWNLALKDSSMFEQIEEVKCDVRKMSLVTILSPVRADKGQGARVWSLPYVQSLQRA